MKNINKILLLALLIVTFGACEDNEKDPIPVNLVDGPFGAFVRFDLTTAPVLDVTNILTSSFGGTLTTPSNNVASWDVSVRRVSGGVASDYALLLSITSFPATFDANATNISAALGIDISELGPGDRFDFEATSTGIDGSVTTFDNLSVDLGGNPGQAQGYRFNTFISCPFDQAEAIGSYLITDASFFGQIATNFEVIAGAESDEIVMIDPMGHLVPGDAPDKYNVTIRVGLSSGQAVVDRQDAWDSGNPVCCGTPYGPGNIEGTGFVFSCTGDIVLFISRFGVAAGSFGSAPFVARKL